MTKRILFSFVAVAALLNADTLVLRNGNTVRGSYVGGDSRSVRFMVGTEVSTYSLNEVESIRFSTAPQAYAPNPGFSQNPQPSQNTNYPPPSPPPPANASAPDRGNDRGNAQATYYPPQPPPMAPPPSRPAESDTAPGDTAGGNGPARMEVPGGTPIVVRLIDAVNSQYDNMGQTYRASVDEPVVLNGQTLIPRGADTTATLTDLQQSGKIEGRTTLTLRLKTLVVNGHAYDVFTTDVAQASGSRGARSAKVIGGAAALGAIIGAAAGGGKGAAIGAGSGAAVGTAAEVATSGQKVKVPAETRLTFTLRDPIYLKSASY